jgi:hypothetical protein
MAIDSASFSPLAIKKQKNMMGPLSIQATKKLKLPSQMLPNVLALNVPSKDMSFLLLLIVTHEVVCFFFSTIIHGILVFLIVN